MCESERLRLHSGAPYWLLDAGLDEFAAPAADCDVAIIGAGITGALLADRLSEAGVRVTVFDRRAAGYGSTAASTALLQYEIDVELHELIRRIGERDAVRAYRLCAKAVVDAGHLVAGLGIDCGFSMRPSLYLASRRSHARRLRRECEAREAAGFEVSFRDRAAVLDRYGLPSFGAIHSALGAVVDPVRLTRALLRRAIGRGAGLCTRTTVEAVTSTESGVHLETRRGRCRAERVIYATGYEVPERLDAGLVALHSSYALVTEPLTARGRWDDGCLVWESARPYCYLRPTPDGRVLMGGADVPYRDPDWRDRLLPDRTRRLERRLADWLPDAETTTAFSWAGTFGETRDGLPLIGEDVREPRLAYALGYGGNGITFGLVAADLLRDWCLRVDNDDARVFRVDR